MGISDEPQFTGVVAIAILILVGMLLFFGRECNREDTKYRQSKDEIRLKCIQTAQNPLQCSQVF